MVAFNELAKRKARHVMVYGPPKIGKTTLALAMAKEGYNIDLLDLESGSSVAEQFPVEAQGRINVVPIPDTRDWPIAIETVMKISKFVRLPYKICLEHGKISCPLCLKNNAAVWSVIDFSKYTDKNILVVDSLTQLTQSTMAQVIKGQPEDFKPGWDEYGRQGLLLNYVLGNFQNSPFNIICVTHETATETTPLEGDKTERLFPTAGTTNFSRTCAKFFDDVVHMDIYNRRHRATSSTTAKPQVLTGSRAGISLEDMQVPSLLPFFTGKMPDVTPTIAQQASNILKGVQK